MDEKKLYLSVEKGINEVYVEAAEKIVSDHCHNMHQYQKIKPETILKYELKVQPHSDLKSNVYGVYLSSIMGLKKLFYFDNDTNLYRFDSVLFIDHKVIKPKLVKVGNINNNEYLFVRGQIGNFYI